MGIPHYFRIITQTYSGIVGFTLPPADHIFFDFNGAIHQSAKKVIDLKRAQATSSASLYEEDIEAAVGGEEAAPIEKEIMETVEEYVRRLTNLVRPKKGVHIYMDGVAPHAKLMQQRKRRYLAVLRHRLLGSEPIWDTNAISPGTMFMVRLGAFLKARFREKQIRSGVDTRFSFSDENGEAEHKIFAAMASIPHDERVIIHGLDADLIMLSLLAHRPNITLMREPHDGADFQYLHIDQLRVGILKELATRYAWPIGAVGAGGAEEMDVFGQQARDAIESYIVWCFLLGNDFLPHLPTLHLQKNGLQTILMASQHTMLVSSRDASIDWHVMHRIVEELSVQEDNIMYSLVAENMRRKCHAKTDEEKVDMYPLLEHNRSPLVLELYNKGYSRENRAWRPVYYKHLFHTRMHDMSVVRDACREYMAGIEWTYRYYKRLARDPTWYYPYGYAPTMTDLANHIATSKDEHAAMVEKWKVAYKMPTFIPDYVQLLCILPPESVGLIPVKLRPIVQDQALGCTHMYPRKYPISTFLKSRLWECHPVLPQLDIPLLQKKASRIVTQVERLKPRARATEAFSRGFHIAR